MRTETGLNAAESGKRKKSADILAGCSLVKVRVFNEKFPEGKVNLAPVYLACQQLGGPRV
jgi:hypothetical protein